MFRTRRKPSILPVTAEPAPLAPTTPGPRTSRATNIIAVSPKVGMFAILRTDGKEITIQITEELDYQGLPPTTSEVAVAFVRPVPPFVTGVSIALFINERHYIAQIKHVVTHETPPRIDTSYVQQVTTPPFSLSFLTSDTGSHNRGEFEVQVTHPDSDPALPPEPVQVQVQVQVQVHEPEQEQEQEQEQEAPARPRGATSTNRTRALTLSTAAKNIAEQDMELWESYRNEYPPATFPPTPDDSPSPKRQSLIPLDPDPATPSPRPRPTRKSPPSIGPSLIESSLEPAPRASRVRTASMTAAPTTMEENRLQTVHGDSQLSPMEFSVPVAMHRAETPPLPRRRLHSDAAVNPPRSHTSFRFSRAPDAVSKPASAAPTDTRESVMTRISRFTRASSKLLSNGANFGKHKASVPERVEGGDIDVWADTAPSIPLPIGLHNAVNRDPSEPEEEREVSWIQYELPQETLTPIEHLQVPPESIRGPSEKSKGKQRAVDSRRGSVLRVPLHSSSGTSVAQSTLSNESLRISALKDLPPIPSSSNRRSSTSTCVRTRISDEHIWMRSSKGAAKGLGAMLDLTPPPSRRASFAKPSRLSANAHSSSTPTPESNTDSTPISRATASRRVSVDSAPAHPITPTAHARIHQIKPLIYLQAPTPPHNMPLVKKRTVEPDAALADDSSATTSASMEALRYTTAPSTVRHSAASTDRGYQSPLEGYANRANPPLTVMLNGDSKGRVVSLPTDNGTARRRSSMRSPPAKV